MDANTNRKVRGLALRAIALACEARDHVEAGAVGLGTPTGRGFKVVAVDHGAGIAPGARIEGEPTKDVLDLCAQEQERAVEQIELLLALADGQLFHALETRKNPRRRKTTRESYAAALWRAVDAAGLALALLPVDEARP